MDETSVSGPAIATVLRINGVAVDTISLHVSLLAGPFKIDNQTYRVARREVVKRDHPHRKSYTDDAGVSWVYPIDLPDWVVALDLEPVEATVSDA
jgi:hypothetical protein